MTFSFSDSHILEHRTLGYTVFRNIIPPSLLKDLRRVAAGVREVARKLGGPRAMRLQGLTGYDGDRKPLEDYAQLPALVEAIGRLLTPRHKLNGEHTFLIEPADMPICQAWHRDLRETDAGVEVEEFRRVQYDPLFFNQVNCPLYEDTCLWYVPGSQSQPDLPEEVQAARTSPMSDLTREYTTEEREQLGLAYCRAMPGALCLALHAGDFAVYHPLAWHTGNYLPHKIRATLHDTIRTPEVEQWYARREARMKGA